MKKLIYFILLFAIPVVFAAPAWSWENIIKIETADLYQHWVAVPIEKKIYVWTDGESDVAGHDSAPTAYKVLDQGRWEKSPAVVPILGFKGESGVVLSPDRKAIAVAEKGGSVKFSPLANESVGFGLGGRLISFRVPVGLNQDGTCVFTSCSPGIYVSPLRTDAKASKWVRIGELPVERSGAVATSNHLFVSAPGKLLYSDLNDTGKLRTPWFEVSTIVAQLTDGRKIQVGQLMPAGETLIGLVAVADASLKDLNGLYVLKKIGDEFAGWSRLAPLPEAVAFTSTERNDQWGYHISAYDGVVYLATSIQPWNGGQPKNTVFVHSFLYQQAGVEKNLPPKLDEPPVVEHTWRPHFARMPDGKGWLGLDGHHGVAVVIRPAGTNVVLKSKESIPAICGLSRRGDSLIAWDDRNSYVLSFDASSFKLTPQKTNTATSCRGWLIHGEENRVLRYRNLNEIDYSPDAGENWLTRTAAWQAQGVLPGDTRSWAPHLVNALTQSKAPVRFSPTLNTFVVTSGRKLWTTNDGRTFSPLLELPSDVNSAWSLTLWEQAGNLVTVDLDAKRAVPVVISGESTGMPLTAFSPLYHYTDTGKDLYFGLFGQYTYFPGIVSVDEKASGFLSVFKEFGPVFRQSDAQLSMTQQRMFVSEDGEIFEFSAAGYRPISQRVLGQFTKSQADHQAITKVFGAIADGNLSDFEKSITLLKDVDARGDGGRTPLMYAAERKQGKIIELLLERGADPTLTNHSRSALDYLRQGLPRRQDLEELLVRRTQEIDLINAARVGDQPRVKAALVAKVNIDVVDQSGETALMKASRGGHHGIVASLLEKGADPARQNSAGQSAFDIAVEAQAEKVRMLLAGPTYISKIKAGIESGDEQVLKYYLGSSTAATLLPENAAKFFRVALDSSASVAMKLLLQHGVDPNLKMQGGRHPLHEAVRLRKPQLVEILLAHGAEINRREAELTPLMWAVLRGESEIVQLLLGAKAEVNAVVENGRSKGWSSLMFAARSGSLPITKLLVEHGAILDAENADGDTAEDIAAKNKHEAVEDYLDDAG